MTEKQTPGGQQAASAILDRLNGHIASALRLPEIERVAKAHTLRAIAWALQSDPELIDKGNGVTRDELNMAAAVILDVARAFEASVGASA